MKDPILVVGGGAVGLWIAGSLADERDVTVATRTRSQAWDLRKGLRITWPDMHMDKAAAVYATERPSAKIGPFRALILCTKFEAAAKALEPWLPHLEPDAPVIAVQNGIVAPVIERMCPGPYVDACVTFPVGRPGPAHAERTGPGGFTIGPWPVAGPRDDPKLYHDVAMLLSAAGPVEASPNMEGVRWSKLLINSCISSLGALAGENLQRVMKDRHTRDVFRAIVREGVEVGLASGIEFETVAGFRPKLLGSLPAWAADRILRRAASRFPRHRSSSLQSLERGEKTEVRELNGYIVSKGLSMGIPTPTNTAVLAAVERLEAGLGKPDPALLHHIPA